jgi:prepilin-type N-terminal cleavage/methylation domain-containing protein
MSRRRGFTLVEMMLATVLAAMLIGGVMTVASGLSRDRRRMQERMTAQRPTVLIELLRKDLANASAVIWSSDAGTVVLVGHGGLDPKSLTPTGRLAEVTYRVRGRGAAAALVREQRYLDDAIRPQPWREVVSVGVRDFAIAASSDDAETVRLGEDVAQRLGEKGLGGEVRVTRVPSRVRLQLEVDGRAIHEEVNVR